MYQKVELDPDEPLVCIFFRDVDSDSVATVETVDFERRMHLDPPEGGISFFRANICHYLSVVENVQRKAKLNRGLATITVKEVVDLGYYVMAGGADDAHVELHCASCNGAERDCSAGKGSCPFISPEHYQAQDDVARKKLAEAMTVVIEATNTRADLIKWFASDLKKEDAKVANKEYVRRWETNRAQSAKANA